MSLSEIRVRGIIVLGEAQVVEYTRTRNHARQSQT